VTTGLGNSNAFLGFLSQVLTKHQRNVSHPLYQLCGTVCAQLVDDFVASGSVADAHANLDQLMMIEGRFVFGEQ